MFGPLLAALSSAGVPELVLVSLAPLLCCQSTIINGSLRLQVMVGMEGVTDRPAESLDLDGCKLTVTYLKGLYHELGGQLATCRPADFVMCYHPVTCLR